MVNKVMLAVNETTKEKFRLLNFPDYVKGDDARILYLITIYNDKKIHA